MTIDNEYVKSITRADIEDRIRRLTPQMFNDIEPDMMDRMLRKGVDRFDFERVKQRLYDVYLKDADYDVFGRQELEVAVKQGVLDIVRYVGYFAKPELGSR